MNVSSNGRPEQSDERLCAALVELGLTPNQSRAYLSLLRLGPLTATEVGDASGVPRPKVYGALQSLERDGFSIARQGKATRWEPVVPDAALGEWIRRRELTRKAEASRDAVLQSELLRELPRPPAADSSAPFPLMEAVIGRDSHSWGVAESLIERAERKLDLIYVETGPAPRELWNKAECEAIRRGVQVRLLCGPEAAADPDRWAAIAEAGGEVRMSDRVTLKLALRDESEAVVGLRDPSAGQHGYTAVRISHPDMLSPLQLLFLREWRRATPVSQPEKRRR